MTNCKEIDEYIRLVRKEEFPCCKEQRQLCDLVEEAFGTEYLTVDQDQLERYMGLQKYFEYKLFPWEKFLFALHNCVYDAEGLLRWPDLLAMLGRGAGKNGYLAFEDFALLTPVNGVSEYNIDIFANSEDQAKVTFQDIYNVLEANKESSQDDDCYYKRKCQRWTFGSYSEQGGRDSFRKAAGQRVDSVHLPAG